MHRANFEPLTIFGNDDAACSTRVPWVRQLFASLSTDGRHHACYVYPAGHFRQSSEASNSSGT